MRKVNCSNLTDRQGLMETAPAHGAIPKKDLLPYRPRLRSRQSISSFLAKLAMGYGLSISELLLATGISKNRKSWHLGDMDLPEDDKLLKALSLAVGHSVVELRSSSLLPYNAILLLKQHGSQTCSWLLKSTEDLNESRALPSVISSQFCRLCIRTGEPYRRIDWRFSFVTVCPRHRAFLLDTCPACGKRQTLQFGLNEGPSDSAFRCQQCGLDFKTLRKSPIERIPENLVKRLLVNQQLLLTLLDLARTNTKQVVQECFSILGSVVSLVCDGRTPNPQARRIQRFLAAHLVLPPLRRRDELSERGFDYLSSDLRARFLLMASSLLDPWPENFRALSADFPLLEKCVPAFTTGNDICVLGLAQQPESGLQTRHLLGSSLGHRVLQQLLSSGSNLTPENSNALRWMEEGGFSEVSERNFRQKELLHGLPLTELSTDLIRQTDLTFRGVLCSLRDIERNNRSDSALARVLGQQQVNKAVFSEELNDKPEL